MVDAPEVLLPQPLALLLPESQSGSDDAAEVALLGGGLIVALLRSTDASFGSDHPFVLGRGIRLDCVNCMCHSSSPRGSESPCPDP